MSKRPQHLCHRPVYSGLPVRLVVALVAVLVVGCSKQGPTVVHPVPSRQFPIAVGLYVPVQVREATYHGSVLFTKYSIEVGKESLTQLTAGLRRLFRDVVVLKGPVSVVADETQALALIIEPSIGRVAVDSSLMGLGKYQAIITYNTTIYNAKGQTIFTTTATGKGGASGKGKEGPQTAAREAIRGATAHILTTIQASTTIQALAFASRGLHVWEQGKAQYYKGEFLQAVATLQGAIALLTQDPSNTYTDQVVDAYVLIGSSHIATGAQEQAKAAFREAMRLRPDLTLDPTVHAPKVRRMWHEVRETLHRQ